MKYTSLDMNIFFFYILIKYFVGIQVMFNMEHPDPGSKKSFIGVLYFF